MNVTVFGLGYVGCVSAACFARDGHQVTGVDVNADKVALINDGTSPIIEPGIGELVERVVRAGSLKATTSMETALHDCDVALICVGTADSGNGRPDLEPLARVSEAIARESAGRTRPLTVVLRSTVLPGTTARLLGSEIEKAGNAAVTVAVNPEFMREGSSIEDFDHPPFILVGCDNPAAADTLRELYASVAAPFVQTTIPTAEMAKFVCNAFHALKICFTNEIADLCRALGADAHEVMNVFKRDDKLNISPAYLRPGFAFGGSCLPKDVRALLSAGRSHDVPLPLLDAIIPSNDGQIHRAIQAVLATGHRRIGVVGLAFKPDTDDLRESPMVALVEALIGKGRDVRVLDPNVVMARLKGANRRYIETEIPHISAVLCEDAEALAAHAEVLVFAAADAHAKRVLNFVDARHTIVDLTRGLLPGAPRAAEPADVAVLSAAQLSAA
jgi:GDP-mannose 6-dehydrogenase